MVLHSMCGQLVLLDQDAQLWLFQISMCVLCHLHVWVPCKPVLGHGSLQVMLLQCIACTASLAHQH